jgi:ectoine hydroxylase-related dioxygenase (phytanoyl-CoA dioxygenase family)
MPESSTVPSGLAAQFDRDGYVVLDDIGLPDDVISGVVEDLRDSYTKDGGVHHDEHGVVYYPTRIQDAWKVSENARAIALAPKVLSTLEELHGREPLPFQTLNFWVGTQQKAHSDALHFNSMPSGFMCGVWLALEDMDDDNGPLVYYPGSHKLPEVRMKDIGAEPREDEYPKYERYVEELIEREGLEPHYATIGRGQALVWAANLLHGGAPQRDMSRSRQSQVTHYFFKDTKYYTPMLTTDSETFWRYPQWVT